MNAHTKRDRKSSGKPERQVTLPFGKSFSIALKSLRVRFLRNLITTLTLVLAVSFFSFVNTGTLIADTMLQTGNPEYRKTLVRAGFDIQPEQTRVTGDPKQRWIIVLSLLVCVVGIVNAQLMAVTERFQEIGTMKCLGALDRFILRLFLLEAGMQGIVGAAAGGVLGVLGALILSFFRFGFVTIRTLDGLETLGIIALSTLTGFLLSVLGVLYPAVVAARMKPVEAMRAEN